MEMLHFAFYCVDYRSCCFFGYFSIQNSQHLTSPLILPLHKCSKTSADKTDKPVPPTTPKLNIKPSRDHKSVKVTLNVNLLLWTT